MKSVSLCAFLFLLSGCAAIEAQDVRNNAFYNAVVTVDSDLVQTSKLTEDILKECYPTIGFSMSGGVSAALELYKKDNSSNSSVEYTMGNITYGGLLVIDLIDNNRKTSVKLSAKDNGWNEKFPKIVKSFESQSTVPCKDE